MNSTLPSLKLKPLSLACILALSNTVAHAQDDADKNSKTETIVVTATGSDINADEAPASVSIISQAELQLAPIKDIGDVLRHVNGITISNWAGGRNTINMRGLDEDYVLMLVNGKRVSSSNGLWRGGNFDNTSIPLASINRVEVIRGPMSALYGSDAVGGVINIITHQPKEEWQGEISVQNSFMQDGEGGDRHRYSIYTSGQLQPNLGMTFSAETAEQDIWVEREITPNFDTIEGRETLKLNAGIQWKFAENQQLDFDISKDEDDVPMTNYGAMREQSIDRTTLGISYKAEWSWGGSDILVNRSKADLYDYNQRYSLQPPLGRNIDETNTTIRATSFVDFDAHQLTFGVERLKTEIDDPVQYPVTGGADTTLDSIFAQDQWDINDNLTATIGARFEDSDQYGTHLSPRAYLVYQLNDDVIVKGGIGSAFRAPTLFESSPSFSSVSCRGLCSITGNPELKEETSTNTELALLVSKQGWSLDVTLFDNKVKNLIEVSAWDGESPERAYFNNAEVDLRGVEIAANLDFSQLLDCGFSCPVSLEANYSYLDNEDSQGRELAYRPMHNGNLRLNWQITDMIASYVQVSYYGEHIGFRQQDLKSYSITNIGASFKLNDSIGLKAGITNVGDEQPVLDDPTSDTILQGRALFLAADYQF